MPVATLSSERNLRIEKEELWDLLVKQFDLPEARHAVGGAPLIEVSFDDNALVVVYSTTVEHTA